MRRYVVVLGAVLAMAGFPPSALGGTYGWEGTVGPGYGNGNCEYYSGQSACSGLNYWYQLND